VTYPRDGALIDARVIAQLPDRRALRAALIVGLAYYLGARLGLALTLRPDPISTLWPPNSILLAALLLTPVRWWGLLLLGALPAHLAVELAHGFPLELVIGWFISNCSEALIGAGIIRHLLNGPPRFDRSGEVGIFICAVFLGIFLSCFLDVGFVTLSRASSAGFWQLWRTRFFSNVLAALTLIPAIVTWGTHGVADLRSAAPNRYLESGVLLAALLAVSVIVFNRTPAGLDTSPALLYAPLPFVLWAAVRLDPRGTSTSLLIVTALAIWGAVHARGPFLTRSPAENALSLQLFLAVFSIAFLLLAAVVREREQAEHAARESEDRLNLALCASQTGTWEWRLADDSWSMSLQSRRIMGLADADPIVTLTDFLRVVSSDDRSLVARVLHQSVANGSPYECEFRTVCPDGVHWVLSKGEVIPDRDGAPQRLVAAIVDITERKLAERLRQEEATLRESEARLQELANAMPQIVWTAAADGELDYFNRRWYELTGTSDSILANQHWLSLTHPDDRQQTLDAWRQAVAAGEPCEVEHRLRMAETGEYRWHLARARPIRDQNGTVVRWYGSCTDIQDHILAEQALRDAHGRLEERVQERTSELSAAVLALRTEISERVAAERALRSSEQRFSKAFHSSPDAIVIVRQKDYRFVEVNEKWEAMFGYSRAEVIGRSAGELGLTLYEEQRKRKGVLGQTQEHLRDVELEARTRSGGALHVLLRTDSLEMGGEACHIITLRDVTARKRAESAAEEQRRELAHLSRVASLGELSGALAHELNQPLAAILANTRAAQRLVRHGGPELTELREILEDIALDDQRAGEVITRLRSLLKKEEARPSEVSLNELVAEVRALLHSDLIRRRVSVQTELAPSLPAVVGDRVELQQVLLNLIANACDAMAGKPADQRVVTISTSLNTEDRVQLSVRDQGEGIAPERLDQIFDAFYSTKDHGLGLGLAICRSIVTAHGGRLWAVNNAAVGATFHLVLNRSDLSGKKQPVGEERAQSVR
jgi:PAS domain S-box-containing protein